MKTRFVPAIALVAGALASPAPAVAECRLAQVHFTPEADLQLAVWIEDAEGNFLDTLFVTQATGTYGLGNRPGRPDFNTNYLWPYGRREGVLPVWAHRRGVDYPRVIFQNGDDNNLSHPAQQSTQEPYFCQPMTWQENNVDGISCVTTYVGTDKGKLSDARSVYPPRQDVGRGDFDSADVDLYPGLNDLDAVSRATPEGSKPYTVMSTLDPELPAGNYVVWVEASRERDYNLAWSPSQYPAPAGIPFNEYGDPFRGQPSIVWKVPVSLATGVATGQVVDYVGYGDVMGLSGAITEPDDSISAMPSTFQFDQDGAGSRPMATYKSLGAARLQLVSGPDGMYKVRVEIGSIDDPVPPGPVSQLAVQTIVADAASLSFVSSGDDGLVGKAAEYEIRLKAAVPLTAANFTEGELVADGLAAVDPGGEVTFDLSGLLPQTKYYLGVRAKDECLAAGEPVFIEFVTAAAEGGEVDACFVATAAWGSLLDTQVSVLRRFRDQLLRRQVLGEVFIEAYYTFAPALAEVIEPSATLRGLARTALEPVSDAAAARLR